MGDAAVGYIERTSNTIKNSHNHLNKQSPCDYIWEYYLMPEASDVMKRPFKDIFKAAV
jgi:hypothetical protein